MRMKMIMWGRVYGGQVYVGTGAFARPPGKARQGFVCTEMVRWPIP